MGPDNDKRTSRDRMHTGTPPGLMLVVGQKWYVKLPGNPMLREIKITEVTPKTVNVRPMDQPRAGEVRFAIADVDFVEQPVEANPNLVVA